MIDFKIKLHRNFLPADTQGQKLFILFEIDPEKNIGCGKHSSAGDIGSAGGDAGDIGGFSGTGVTEYSNKKTVYKLILNIISIIKNMKIERVSKVYPTQAEIDPSSNPIILGDVESGDASVFLIETSVPGNKPGKASLLKINLACGGGNEGNDNGNGGGGTFETVKTPDTEISIEYSNDNGIAYGTDKEVMHYIQQRNICSMIEQAENESANNANKAIEILKSAMKTAAVLNNASMTRVLGRAIKEIEDNNGFKDGTMKTLKTDAKTRTVKFDKNMFTDEEIKKITGV